MTPKVQALQPNAFEIACSGLMGGCLFSCSMTSFSDPKYAAWGVGSKHLHSIYRIYRTSTQTLNPKTHSSDRYRKLAQVWQKASLCPRPFMITPSSLYTYYPGQSQETRNAATTTTPPTRPPPPQPSSS